MTYQIDVDLPLPEPVVLPSNGVTSRMLARTVQATSRDDGPYAGSSAYLAGPQLRKDGTESPHYSGLYPVGWVGAGRPPLLELPESVWVTVGRAQAAVTAMAAAYTEETAA